MAKKLKIGFICTSRALGGLELSTYKFGLWMRQRGHDVHFILDEKSLLIKYMKENNLPYNTIKKGRKYLDFAGARQLTEEIKKIGYEHFIITLNADIDLCALTKTFYFKKFNFYYFQEMQLGVVKKHFFFNWKFSKLSKWISPLDWLYKQVLERTNVPESKLIKAPLSIEVEKFDKLEMTKSAARDFFKLPQDVFLFGFIGRIDKIKNPTLIVTAFEKIATQVPNAHLMIMGEKTRDEVSLYGDDLLAQINASPFKARIHTRGFTDRVDIAYKALDTFIMATDSEAIGLVTIEAMASGTIVIGANGGGTPELLNFGDAGYLFEVQNVDSLATQMQRAYDEFDQRHIMLNKAKERAYAKYSHHITCDVLEKMIENEGSPI
jgi:glycosyltransferase involved in cell wall biosynthesis